MEIFSKKWKKNKIGVQIQIKSINDKKGSKSFSIYGIDVNTTYNLLEDFFIKKVGNKKDNARENRIRNKG